MAASATSAAARAVLEACRRDGLTLVTAESCTGGLVAAAITDIAGASDVFDRSFITYSNAAKSEMLGVPAGLIHDHGAVSAEVAGAMALGALKAAHAGVAVAITGVAGPGGGSAAKPVGLVHFAVAVCDGRVNRIERRFGALSRSTIRRKAVRTALALITETLAGDTGIAMA